VDLVSLHAQSQEITACETNSQLQKAWTQLSKAKQQKENDDILLWISLTDASADGGFGGTQPGMVVLADKFNAVFDTTRRRVHSITEAC
jgi:hypothetical protein